MNKVTSFPVSIFRVHTFYDISVSKNEKRIELILNTSIIDMKSHTQVTSISYAHSSIVKKVGLLWRWIYQRLMESARWIVTCKKSNRAIVRFFKINMTLMPKFPFSAKKFAWLVSNAKQSDCDIADATPSWIPVIQFKFYSRLTHLLRGLASQHSRRRLLDNSSLKLTLDY